MDGCNLLLLLMFCFSQNCLPFSDYDDIVGSTNVVDLYSHHLFADPKYTECPTKIEVCNIQIKIALSKD